MRETFGARSATASGMPDPREWVEKGACFGSYDERFFPSRGESNKEAKRICYEECTVREECLEHALTRPERFGIWGGTAERERQTMRKERNEEARRRLIRAKATP